VRELIFVGEHRCDVDEQGRLTLPSEISSRVASQPEDAGWFIHLRADGKHWLMRAPHAGAVRVDVDDQGRLLLPRESVGAPESGGTIMLIGVRDHLELWNEADWDTYRADVMKRFMPKSKSQSKHQ
jgi:DNA-binding transcriptional regulator/RsmH inhibitor MraZ